MGFSASLSLLPAQTKHHPSSSDLKRNSSFLFIRKRSPARKSCSVVPVARLFGPAIFESSKLKVLFVGVDEEKHPSTLPRTYTLTHSDITSKLTLAVSSTVHQAQLQGWYSQLQRDEVVAEWKKVKGKMSLHVHCHISGGHFLLDLIASLRYYIFRKELPVVLKAFVHGDVRLFNNYPELEEAPVWVYFQSNLPEFNKVECWGPLRDAASTRRRQAHVDVGDSLDDASTVDEEATNSNWEWPQRCQVECDCCFPLHNSIVPWPRNDGHEEKHKSFLSDSYIIMHQITNNLGSTDTPK